MALTSARAVASHRPLPTAVPGPVMCARIARAPVRVAAIASVATTRRERPAGPVPTPVVRIDNKTDPASTIVTVEFGDRLGELLDTITALRELGLNIYRAKLDSARGRGANTFFVTDVTTSEKITRSAQIEQIRMTVINHLQRHHPESCEVMGLPAELEEPRSQAAAPATVEVAEAPNGSCSVVFIEAPDRPGLLVDIVRTLKGLNINVVSAEIDTIGPVARDELFVTYEGNPLDGPMTQLVVDALQLRLCPREQLF